MMMSEKPLGVIKRRFRLNIREGIEFFKLDEESRRAHVTVLRKLVVQLKTWSRDSNLQAKTYIGKTTLNSRLD